MVVTHKYFLAIVAMAVTHKYFVVIVATAVTHKYVVIIVAIEAAYSFCLHCSIVWFHMVIIEQTRACNDSLVEAMRWP